MLGRDIAFERDTSILSRLQSTRLLNFCTTFYGLLTCLDRLTIVATAITVIGRKRRDWCPGHLSCDHLRLPFRITMVHQLSTF